MTLQQILGKNYKWWYLFEYESRIQLAYLADNIAWVFSKLIAIFGSILIWSLNSNTDKTYILTYLIIGNIWLELSSFTMSIRLGNEINNGKITRYLLTPNNVILLLFVRCLGRSGVAIIQSVLILGLCGLFYLNYTQTLLKIDLLG